MFTTHIIHIMFAGTENVREHVGEASKRLSACAIRLPQQTVAGTVLVRGSDICRATHRIVHLARLISGELISSAYHH